MTRVEWDFHITAAVDASSKLLVPQRVKVVLENGQSFDGKLVGADTEFFPWDCPEEATP